MSQIEFIFYKKSYISMSSKGHWVSFWNNMILYVPKFKMGVTRTVLFKKRKIEQDLVNILLMEQVDIPHIIAYCCEFKRTRISLKFHICDL